MIAKIVIAVVKIASAVSKVAKAAKAVRTVGAVVRNVAQVAQRVATKLTKKKLCSFSGITGVLMAGGSTKPIEEVEVGDQVWATDPETGEEGARTVTHLWVHFDTLTTFSTEAGDVVTTEDHPFWNATDRAWQGPQDFDAGDQVRTADGQLVTAGALDVDSSYAGLAYNLTVDDIHTYYVEVGTADVLVHNTGASCNMPGANGTQFNSKTLINLTKNGSKRIDAENPAPGVRPGQIHYQTPNRKHLYNFGTGLFAGLSNSAQRTLLKTPGVSGAIRRGLKYLGM